MTEENCKIVIELLHVVLVNPPAIVLSTFDKTITAEEFSIGVVEMTHPSILGPRKAMGFQVYNPLGEEMGEPCFSFQTAAKLLVVTIASERMRTVLDNMATEALAQEML